MFKGLSVVYNCNSLFVAQGCFVRFDDIAKSNSHLPLSFWSSSQRGVFFSLRAQALQRQTKESQRRKEKGSREDSTDGRWDPKANETSPQNPMRWAMGWWDDGCPVPGPIWGFFTIQFDYVGTLFFLMGWHCRISIDNSSSMGFPSIEMLRYWYIPIHCCWTNVFCKQIMCVCAKVADRFAECFFPMFSALKPGLFTTAIAEVVNNSWEERSLF